MPKKRTPETEILFILDRSGSMDSMRDDAIGGFNRFLADQKAEPDPARLTLVLFDHEYLVPHDAADIQSVPALDGSTYVPRGQTALLDAVGRTLAAASARIAALPAARRPAKVITAILTDGMENASREFTLQTVSESIRKHTADGWEFLFLAANQDAIATAGRMAIPAMNAMAFCATPDGMRDIYERTSQRVVASRRAPKP